MSNTLLSGTNRATDNGRQPIRVNQIMDSFEAVITQEAKQAGNDRANCTLVKYSAKAVAVFGETRAIKDELKEMGGRFNSRLTHNGQRTAGWVSSKAQQQRLATYFGLD